MPAPANVTIGTTGRGPYSGAIRIDGVTVWTCPHSHHNRDHGSMRHGQAARECAREVLDVAYERDEQREAIEAYYARPMVAPQEAERLARSLHERKFAKSQAERVRAILDAWASAQRTERKAMELRAMHPNPEAVAEERRRAAKSHKAAGFWHAVVYHLTRGQVARL